nr:MAG TPA: Head Tail Connector Protein [Caudoviricetes sp.]
MNYATYDYYTKDFGGEIIPESSFTSACLRASRYIDALTAGKAKDYAEQEAVKDAVCAAAEVAYRYAVSDKQTIETGNKASETIGSYSVSYRQSQSNAQAYSESKSFTDQLHSEMYAAAALYLFSTGLLYRGIDYDNECGCDDLSINGVRI